ncbi:gag_pre-integrs domain-containing protein [Gossypium australe]|uniref:Gag_pre-integrs domain-containing protein n=1 Tax=Gossypium australe TaxID=47621 RepID=A0A5B6V255_9ROSI|nr:gag_pre-integrs domain-containing protein [Gossypium australe]
MLVTCATAITEEQPKSSPCRDEKNPNVVTTRCDFPSIGSDSTRLWHMRLGHMSEKGMTVLCNRGLLKNTEVGTLGFYEHCVFEKQT